MGAIKTSSFDSHVNLLDKMGVEDNIYRKIGSSSRACLLLLLNFVTLLFRFMAGRFFRFNDGDEPSHSETRELNKESKAKDKGEDLDEIIERRMPAFSFKYQIKNFEDAFKTSEGAEEKGVAENSEKKDEAFMIATGVDNYRFSPDKDYNGFVEEKENMAFHVHEEDDVRFLYPKDFLNPLFESILDEEVKENKASDFKVFGSLYVKDRKEDDFLEDKKFNTVRSGTDSMRSRDIRFISEDFSSFDSESATESSSDGYSVKELDYDSDVDGFLSEKDFVGEELNGAENRETLVTSTNKLEQGQRESFLTKSNLDNAEDDDQVHLNDKDDVQETVSEEMLHSSISAEISMKRNSGETFAENDQIGKSVTEVELQIEFVEDSSDDELSSLKNGSARLDSFGEVHFVIDVVDSESKSEVLETEEEVGKIAGPKDDLANFTNALEMPEQKFSDGNSWKGSEVVNKKSEESKTMDFDSEELDELWEHQDLLEQLKMELKRVRASGLPTILEESESPIGIEDLKPFRIDEKLFREDPLDELQKFYKSYREGMRKFDILNYQKMYALGFFQLKNPLHSMGTKRQSFPAILSHLSQNLLIPFRQKKIEDNPSEKLIKELKCDLETVFVGQTCLSWEFLRWQYEKCRELPESDPRRGHQYNQVAGEFQQFQVLIQRFTENEKFQEPRLPNYVKQRCVLRNLLQVPFMKEDRFEENMERKKEGEFVITSETLEGIMEEAIRVFWEFVKADKEETPLLLKVLVESNVELQDPADYPFMAEIQANLQKKEKKLKDLLRTGNCIVRRFKKPKEDRSNQDLFFSQVDLKLVARVLRMSRISSDQLIWCQKKLSNIDFPANKVHREPSFLLFPC